MIGNQRWQKLPSYCCKQCVYDHAKLWGWTRQASLICDRQCHYQSCLWEAQPGFPIENICGWDWNRQLEYANQGHKRPNEQISTHATGLGSWRLNDPNRYLQLPAYLPKGRTHFHWISQVEPWEPRLLCTKVLHLGQWSLWSCQNPRRGSLLRLLKWQINSSRVQHRRHLKQHWGVF